MPERQRSLGLKEIFNIKKGHHYLLVHQTLEEYLIELVLNVKILHISFSKFVHLNYIFLYKSIHGISLALVLFCYTFFPFWKRV